MALTPTQRASGAIVSSDTVTSSSFTPTAGALLIASWAAEWDGTAGLATIGDTWGLTWTQVTQNNDSNFDKFGCWYAIASSATSGTVTITVPTAAGNRRHALVVDEIAGSTATTPVKQFIVNAAAFAATVPMALATAPLSTSLIYTCLLTESDTSATVPTGFTSLINKKNPNGPPATSQVQTAYINTGGAQSNSWTLGPTNMTVGVSIEVLAAQPPFDYKGAGTIIYSTTGGSTVAPTYPTGITSDDAICMFIGMKPSTTGGTGSVTTPTGWTLQGSLLGAGGYGVTPASDTGDCNIWMFTKDTVTGTETGALSVTINTVGTGGVAWGIIMNAGFGTGTYSYAATTGSDIVAGNVSATMSANPGLVAGDLCIYAMVIPTDVTTPAQFSAEAITATGATFNTMTEIGEPDTTVGNQIGGFIAKQTVATGPASAAPVITATAGGTTTNVRGPVGLLRLRRTVAAGGAAIKMMALLGVG